MKKYITSAIRLTLANILVFCGAYPAIVWIIAQLAPGNGLGETITVAHHKQYVNVGQHFSNDRYFWSRPSAVDYNAAGSAGSNKGPSNPDYLATVQARIDTFLVYHPGVKKSDIPSDLVTASGSGLDPNISVKAAKIQIKRIAAVRDLSEITIKQLIEENTEKPFLGFMGPEKVNILLLNAELDNISRTVKSKQ